MISERASFFCFLIELLKIKLFSHTCFSFDKIHSKIITNFSVLFLTYFINSKLLFTKAVNASPFNKF
jgi:hypothetical protein